MADPLTVAMLTLIFAMGCVTILVFNRQLNQNKREIARIKARERSVEAAFEDDESVDLPDRQEQREKQFE
ncbi:hypothetical protein [Haloarcula sp. CGMCC 1.6347]|uniref:hypothetical protein n=1 Tax=Haloarcula sp. CGMCC 1.6347 TaxID=3111455 RepID=UPI00300E7AA4